MATKQTGYAMHGSLKLKCTAQLLEAWEPSLMWGGGILVSSSNVFGLHIVYYPLFFRHKTSHFSHSWTPLVSVSSQITQEAILHHSHFHRSYKTQLSPAHLSNKEGYLWITSNWFVENWFLVVHNVKCGFCHVTRHLLYKWHWSGLL